MSKTREVRWVALILLLICSVGMARHALSNTIYLPVVLAEHTQTPSLTPSPTRTPKYTPTKTPTPTATILGVRIQDVVNPDWGDPLNEYVRIHNYGPNEADLTGWYLRDEGVDRYDFPINFSLAKGQTVRVWTKEGDNTVSDLYWDSEIEIWNNSRDCAYLRDNSEGQKILVDLYCYTPRALDSLMPKRDSFSKYTTPKE